MGRAPCCDKANVKKGPWSPEEDTKLKEFIEKYGTGGNWIALPQKAGLKRCGKSCRLRWLNYLRPNIKHGEFSDDEDRIICSLFSSIGSRWSIIAAQLPGRTDNDIKNYWNTKLKKKLLGVVPSSLLQRKPPQPQLLPSLQHHQTPSSISPYKPINTCNTTSSTTTPTTTYYTPSRTFGGGGGGGGLDHQNISSLPLSSFLNNNINNPSSLFQAQDGTLGPMHHYQVKDNLLMFGGEPSCSSSDGSCNQISYGGREIDQYEHQYGGVNVNVGGSGQMPLESFFYNGVDENQKFIISGGGGWIEKQNGLWGETTPLDQYCGMGVEEIKPIVVTTNSMLIDENKTQQGKVMYF